MKLFFLISGLFFLSCNNPLKLAIPTAFKEKATEYPVTGTKKNKMVVAGYKSSKIKRGLLMSYPGWGREFILENLLLGFVGLQKTEKVQKEKGKFQFSLTDGKIGAQVYGKETQMTRSIEYKLKRSVSIFNSFEQTQDHQYIFSALIQLNDSSKNKTWELLMTNIYERAKDPNPKIFTVIKQDDNGVVTNGVDSLYIKGISIRETINSNGKEAKLPFDVLGGYEIRTSDGVAAIIDVISKKIWFYNELESNDRILISAVGAAIFARRVNDAGW